MNLELSEELKMLREMTCKFAVAEFTPHILECDEHEKYAPEIRKKAAENGLVGAWNPEQSAAPRGLSGQRRHHRGALARQPADRRST